MKLLTLRPAAKNLIGLQVRLHSCFALVIKCLKNSTVDHFCCMASVLRCTCCQLTRKGDLFQTIFNHFHCSFCTTGTLLCKTMLLLNILIFDLHILKYDQKHFPVNTTFSFIVKI